MTTPERHAGQSRVRAAAPRVRLVDVAREAGLSKTTVSAALNGTGRLSPPYGRRRSRPRAAWATGPTPPHASCAPDGPG
ncbi:LacI family DNA-binding transcriptional regulator [Streptomyces roseicoloratus]|uniref:LacI family DNA-binding transcriptional regulator n=1 Tax=Streptomyces roseicoloratus TaxID=2508722 RepID=UPI0035A633CF